MPLSRMMIEQILNADEFGSRLVQDSPILVDVWAAYGEDPERRLDLLLSPAEGIAPAHAARVLAKALEGVQSKVPGPRFVSPLQGFVAASLTLSEVATVVAPLLPIKLEHLGRDEAAGILKQIEVCLQSRGSRRPAAPSLGKRVSALFVLLAELQLDQRPVSTLSVAVQVVEKGIASQFLWVRAPGAPEVPLFRRVTQNRQVQRLANPSIQTVKADAARRVFQASAEKLVWAVIDCGIQSDHPAFQDALGRSRVVRAYDFTRLRRLTSFDILLSPKSDAFLSLRTEIIEWRRQAPVYESDDRSRRKVSVDALLRQLTADVENDRPTSWTLIEPLLRIRGGVAPLEPHGTHVAGIIAGNWPAEDFAGVCPDLRLMDIRILGDTEGETESAVIGALDFVRWLNGRNRWREVHGVNLSIGLKHDVRNWACGQTPVCVACEDLVASGVVVVAAAGNDGWQSFVVADDKRYDGYAPSSIMDPGNAESVITVGSTHRDRPHLYGVSFFSSRGPTGDGRMKPDLVAPGEKIVGPLLNNSLGSLDGTSMAAPHVSGAAALLMARHTELQGQPDQVKRILLETAVDLGRERAAQGYGLVNAFDALQKR